ncbi:nuclease-related domain-containing protein [Streptomyces sp. NPDC088261]|uniref:nuclease-related domain-containing protein n=1 Tax=Streptomyces sp. NPDC088261 TaxID=3365851 RepID=UPI00382C6E1A
MTRLRVAPALRHCQDRLYVTLPDGTGVAWYDRGAGRVSLLPGAGREEVLAALAPYLSGEVTVGPPPVPTPAELDRLALHPDDDLAPNRPGEELYAVLDGLPAPGRAAAAHRGAAHRAALRRDPRQGELLARRTVGDQLDGLDRSDALGPGVRVRVLHSVPLPGADPAVRIDHLLIGPAGVLAIRTLPARDRRVRVADPMVRTGFSAPVPLLGHLREAAERASAALATAVRPVLVVVGASRLRVVPAPVDVRIVRDTEVAALAGVGGPGDLAGPGGVLKPADIESLYATARDRRAWSGGRGAR